MKKHLNASYALYLSAYWISACFVNGYTRLFLSRLGFSADQVGLVLGIDCAAAMALQPMLARAIDRSGRLTMRGVLLGLCLGMLFCGGLVLIPQPKAVLICLFTAMSTMTMAMQPFVNAVGFGYMNRGEKVNFSAAGALSALLICTLVGMAGSAVLILFSRRDERQAS